MEKILINEMSTYQKGVKNQKELTKQEKAIYRKVERKLLESEDSNEDEVMITLLANCCILKNSNSPLDKRLEFWRKFPFNEKILIFNKIQPMIGLNKVSQEKLFQVM